MDQIKAGPKDIFMHLLAIVALYVSAVSFTVLVFQYINLAFPDPLQNGYARTAALSSIRWSIASLVVIFPVYVLTSWFLEKDYRKLPAKRALKIRRWLIYFTLFAAALIIIGDLVTLIYNFLQGELGARFLLKILTVLFVAGSIFWYYLWDLRKSGIE